MVVCFTKHYHKHTGHGTEPDSPCSYRANLLNQVSRSQINPAYASSLPGFIILNLTQSPHVKDAKVTCSPMYILF